MFTKAIQPLARFMGLVALMTAGAAQANTINTVPEDNTPPFYARVGVGVELFEQGEQVFHDDQTAAIYFYRDRNSVPSLFNLLDFFDFNIRGDVDSWGGTEGIEIRKVPGPPIHTTLKSNGTDPVPVWFVSWPELEEALEDDEFKLTKGALESMGPLVGNASFFSEVLHPPESAQVGKITVNAHGLLEDGTAFQFHATAGMKKEPQVRISGVDFQSRGVGQSRGAQAVPEPSGLFLSLTALVVLLGRLRN